MMDRYFVNYQAPEGSGDDVEQIEIEGNKVDVKPDGQEEAAMAKDPVDMQSHAQVENEMQYRDDETEINDLLAGLRGLTMESYFQSEYIGTEVLNYEPVPGKFIGQYPMSDVPNGLAWSLG